MDLTTIYIIITAFTPGPNNIMSATSTMRSGLKKTIPFMLGVLVATFFVFYFTGVINAVFLDQVAIIKKYISYIGAIYIGYLAYKIIISTDLDKPKSRTKKNLFLKAVLLTFVNPKTIIFGFTITGLFGQWGINATTLFLLAIVLALLWFTAVMFWGLIGYLFMKLFPQHQKVFNILMASLLVFSAFLLIIDAI